MILDVRVLAPEFATVMYVPPCCSAGTVVRHCTGVSISVQSAVDLGSIPTARTPGLRWVTQCTPERHGGWICPDPANRREVHPDRQQLVPPDGTRGKGLLCHIAHSCYILLMQANTGRQRIRPTLTEQARRAQIITAAIETIADLGYARASFAQIAKRAGLSSTGLISYHFTNKKDLDWEIVKEIYGRLTQHMSEAMADVPDPQAALVAYIEGLIGFMKIEPFALQAMVGIVMHGGVDYDTDSERESTSGISEILQRGQAEGVFREFDVQVMATTIQRSLDGIPLAQSTNPDLDLDTYARELVELFTLATRKHD